MGYTIAVAGKGGTGKTTVAALIVRIISEKKMGSILAVDADPNSNLAETLGIEVKETIGQILDDIAAHPEKIPAGTPKDTFIEYQVQMAVQEAAGFDILTMGRPEGPGCYCYVNNVLRNIVGRLIKEYDYIVIDNEAGLEHFSRRTTRACDALVVVSDATVQGLKAARKISELAKDLEIKIKRKFLIINRYDQALQENKTARLGLDYIGSIPEDSQISSISLNGKTLMDLGDNAVSITALRKLGENLWQGNLC